MKTLNLKTYVLPDGETVVSYHDVFKNKRVLKKFRVEAEAREFENTIKYRYESRVTNSFEDETNVERLLRIYFERTPKSQLKKCQKLTAAFLDAFALFSIHDATDVKLRSFFIEEKNENEYSTRTMLRNKSMLQQFFKFLVDGQVIRQSPLDQIKFERMAPYKRKPVVLDEKFFIEVIRLAKRQSPALFYPIFLLIRETAAKSGDIIKLQWKNVNLKTRAVELIHLTEPQRRGLPISEELVTALTKIERVGPNVFTGMNGRELYMQILIRELRRFQRRANLSPDWTISDLRTTVAANFLRKGGTIRELQKLLGHTHWQQTDEVYGRYKSFRARDFYSPTAVTESEAVDES